MITPAPFPWILVQLVLLLHLQVHGLLLLLHDVGPWPPARVGAGPVPPPPLIDVPVPGALSGSLLRLNKKIQKLKFIMFPLQEFFVQDTWTDGHSRLQGDPTLE